MVNIWRFKKDTVDSGSWETVEATKCVCVCGSRDCRSFVCKMGCIQRIGHSLLNLGSLVEEFLALGPKKIMLGRGQTTGGRRWEAGLGCRVCFDQCAFLRQGGFYQGENILGSHSHLGRIC